MKFVAALGPLERWPPAAMRDRDWAARELRRVGRPGRRNIGRALIGNRESPIPAQCERKEGQDHADDKQEQREHEAGNEEEEGQDRERSGQVGLVPTL